MKKKNLMKKIAKYSMSLMRDPKKKQVEDEEGEEGTGERGRSEPLGPWVREVVPVQIPVKQGPHEEILHPVASKPSPRRAFHPDVVGCSQGRVSPGSRPGSFRDLSLHPRGRPGHSCWLLPVQPRLLRLQDSPSTFPPLSVILPGK